MKTAIFCLLAFIVTVAAVAQATFMFGAYTVVNSSTTAPIQLTNTTLKVRSVTLLGKKGPQTTNATTVFVGFTSGNGEQVLSIDPGSAIGMKSVDGLRSLSLSNIWFDVTTANDGLVVIYE